MAKKQKEEYLLEIFINNRDYGLQRKYEIYYMNIKGEPIMVPLPTGVWNKGSIIDALIRSQYSQDQVEAIVNNHFLNISEWMDLKFKGEDVKFSDPEYDEFQRWRKRCKVLAEEALAQYPAIN